MIDHLGSQNLRYDATAKSGFKTWRRDIVLP